jgi:hypothetical protein
MEDLKRKYEYDILSDLEKEATNLVLVVIDLA